MSIESRIAHAFGYEYCILFPNARSAIPIMSRNSITRARFPAMFVPSSPPPWGTMIRCRWIRIVAWPGEFRFNYMDTGNK